MCQNLNQYAKKKNSKKKPTNPKWTEFKNDVQSEPILADMWWWHARKIKDKIPLFHITFEHYQQSLLSHSSFLADFRCNWPLFGLKLPFCIEGKMFGITWSILALFSPIVYNSFFSHFHGGIYSESLFGVYWVFHCQKSILIFCRSQEFAWHETQN